MKERCGSGGWDSSADGAHDKRRRTNLATAPSSCISDSVHVNKLELDSLKVWKLLEGSSAIYDDSLP